MNYQESALILEKIKKAKKILINCHRNPDADSVGSALALYELLNSMDKYVELICPTDVQRETSFLKNYDRIQKVDFSSFEFAKFDLFIVLDSGNWRMVSNNEKIPIPPLKLIVIDHHKTNNYFGTVNLVDDKLTSTGELLYRVLEDWGVEINKDIASSLLTGIISDTGAFRFEGADEVTLQVAINLIKKGANKDEIVFNLFKSNDFSVLKFWGEVVKQMKVDEIGKFVWSAIPYNLYLKYNNPKIGRETSATLFAETVLDTNFGFVMTEEIKGILSVSFRSRTGFDTSKIAQELGGGGHIYASGARIEGLTFEEAVEKVLQVARKYAKEK